MSADVHANAGQLIAQARVEGISAAEQSWLQQHLAECERCAEQAHATEEAIRALRGVAIPLPRTLASRAQMRVRLRAQELREREPQRRLLWFTCGMSWALGVASAPYVWRIFEWLGKHTGIPKLALEMGFGLWWAIPALFAAAIVLMESTRQASENDWAEKQK
jgi:anti-sigma factor RsiW